MPEIREIYKRYYTRSIAKKFLETAITIPVKKKVIGIIMEAKPKL